MFGVSLLLAGLAPPSVAAAADADLRLIGGNASSAIVCGNVAAAQQSAERRHIKLQRSNCTAQAVGGSVVLQNVEVLVSAAARALNRNDPVLAALAAVVPPAVAQDKCENHRPTPGPGRQLNKCRTLARGGKITLINVKSVSQLNDGSVVTQKIESAAIPPGNGGSASAVCANLVNDPLNQRDDCTGISAGGAWSMAGVDVVLRNPDGTSSTRHGITIEVRGGSADALVSCFNVRDETSGVIQINICNSDAQGGDATLRNVTFHL